MAARPRARQGRFRKSQQFRYIRFYLQIGMF
jgi:hypothetical protein